jgi:hypothetical protein
MHMLTTARALPPRRYVEIEREIARIAPVHNIGALSLETAPLKYSLRSEAASWKAMYGLNLHEQAKVPRRDSLSHLVCLVECPLACPLSASDETSECI